MDKHIYDEKNGLGYTLYGDYYLPDMELPEDEEAHYGKYEVLRKTYLKEQGKAWNCDGSTGWRNFTFERKY